MSNVAGVQQARDRVLQMARQIEDLSQSAAPPDTFFPEFLRLVVTSLGGRAGAIWTLDGGARLTLATDVRYAETGIRDDPQSAHANERLLVEAMATGQAACFAPDDPGAADQMPARFPIILAV